MSVVVVLVVSACGLPGDGTVTRVDDDEVPYHLLEPVPPSSGTTPTTSFPGATPVLYWLADDRLVPETAHSTCTSPGQAVVDDLLAQLSAGPPGDVLQSGGGSAIPSGTPLALVSLEDGLAEVQVDLGTTIAADRLPVAVGQIVLSVASAADVSSVVLVSDGQRIQVPLPNGALTQRAVTALDYAGLVPARYRQPGRAGCPHTT
jgi:hypothetical protein